ncbi:hypothetical protein BTA51_11400 [Hahella sp. CCB-MM4]|uniref:hypothetical protein n=1 Tax=Hahella sp. (strain CCB-MM4) TaxID=1926491 RepID=UPI000B9A1FE6|nr:hypothetical protein [Hahella sp. CCB-MM4]OZG73095.1 hypothetical protein BTA51_11400 [Hahella sp. CCB-MM4]
MKRSIDSAIFLAAFTGLLYTWSTAYYHGYLGVMGLDADMMERSFHQVIYGGLLNSFSPIFAILLLATPILFLYSNAVLPSYIDWVRGSVRAKKRVIKFRHFWFGKRNEAYVERRAKKITSNVAIFTAFVFLYIVSLVYFEHKGVIKAKAILEKHVTGKNKFTDMINVVIGDDRKFLRFLACGENNCAGIENKSNYIYYFSSSSGYSYLHQEPEIVDTSK